MHVTTYSSQSQTVTKLCLAEKKEMKTDVYFLFLS